MKQASVPESHSPTAATLTVELRAIRHNFHTLTKQAFGAECAAAVKANAYGLGLEPVAQALAGAGCRSFFVARVAEGQQLRKLLPTAIIYVLDGLLQGEAKACYEANLIPALTSLAQAREWGRIGHMLEQKLPCALHVDTGINRLGFSIADFQTLVTETETLAKLDVQLVMSHLACSDEPTHPLNAKQAQAFAHVRSLMPAVKASLANSSGIFLGKDYTHDLVRPGIALYGGNPTPDKPNPMRTVAVLEAKLLQLRDLEVGATVGYGASWQASSPTRAAIFNVGYRDGIPRSLSSSPNRSPAEVFIAGQRCPIIGRVSMDMTVVDVTAIEHSLLKEGSTAEIFGHNISVDEAATKAQTISYELLTHIGNRYAKYYLHSDSEAQR